MHPLRGRLVVLERHRPVSSAHADRLAAALDRLVDGLPAHHRAGIDALIALPAAYRDGHLYLRTLVGLCRLAVERGGHADPVAARALVERVLRTGAP